jgi:hypothetical protein
VRKVIKLRQYSEEGYTTEAVQYSEEGYKTEAVVRKVIKLRQK